LSRGGAPRTSVQSWLEEGGRLAAAAAATARRGPPGPLTGLDRALWLAVLAGLVLLVALGGFYLATPPADHVAPGCFWWTSKPVDQVAPGDRGCIRGYFISGGGLAASSDPGQYALRMDLPSRDCAPQPGDAVVVKGEAVVSDGRTQIQVDDCR
jgi:hypothetical protein